MKAAYQEVVEQMVKVFEDDLNEPEARGRALAIVALCVGGMVLARNVGDACLADDLRRAAHAEVLRRLELNLQAGDGPRPGGEGSLDNEKDACGPRARSLQ